MHDVPAGERPLAALDRQHRKTADTAQWIRQRERVQAEALAQLKAGKFTDG